MFRHMAPLLPLRRRPLSRVTRRSRHVLHTQARGAGDTWRGAGFNQPGTLLDRLRRRTFPTFTHIDNRQSADRAGL